jgi:hypothetical protein
VSSGGGGVVNTVMNLRGVVKGEEFVDLLSDY